MSNREEIKSQLREIRMKIALTRESEERDNLVTLADKLHKDYAKCLVEEIRLERKRGR